MAELAAGIVGLAGTAKTCIDLWEIITTARNATEDLTHTINMLRTEQIRFLLWCKCTGMLHMASEIDSGLESQFSNLHLWRANSGLLIRPNTPEFLRNHARAVMTTMCKVLQQLEKLLSAYNTCNPPVEHSRVLRNRAKNRILRWTGMPLIEMSALAQLSATDETEVNAAFANSFWDRTKDGIKWSVQGKKDSTDLMTQLRLSNDGLRDILDLLDRNQGLRLRRWFETTMATTPMAELIASDESYSRSSVRDPEGQLRTLCQISLQQNEFRPLVERDGNWSVFEVHLDGDGSVAGHPEASSSTRNQHSRINQFDLQIIESESQEVAERSFGHYLARPCVIEWRYYSSRLSNEDKTHLEGKVSLLTGTLESSASIANFSILRCRGYVLYEHENRFGMLFDYPLAGSTPITLRDRMVNDLRSGLRRDLGDRFKLAAQLSRSLYQFFAVGWLHKNVRSSSILLFDETASEQHLPAAYLAGFGSSRRNILREGTEQLPSILSPLSEDREWLLYVHPHRRQSILQGGTAARMLQLSNSNMLYDTYGLGVVLLEIGLWCPAIKLCSRGHSVDQAQEAFLTQFELKLRFYMGERYTSVVLRCLSGDLGEETKKYNHGVAAFNEQVFLEAFEQQIVTELEQISV